MDFAFTEDQELFRKAVRGFTEKEIAPIARECDESGQFPLSLFRKIGELGYLGAKFPPEYGGSGAGLVSGAIMAEEMSQASSGIFLGIYVHVYLAISAVAAFGTEAQKETYLLPRLVGYGRACEILMTGEPIDAREAERIGLVNRVVPHEDLDAATQTMVERLASRPPLGLKLTKKALYSGLDKDMKTEFDYEHFAQVKCLLTEDYQEGRRAFMEKRQPVFRGR